MDDVHAALELISATLYNKLSSYCLSFLGNSQKLTSLYFVIRGRYGLESSRVNLSLLYNIEMSAMQAAQRVSRELPFRDPDGQFLSVLGYARKS
jgi:hypothetical protein